MQIYRTGDFLKDKLLSMVQFLEKEFDVILRPYTFAMPEIELSSEEVIGNAPSGKIEELLEKIGELKEYLSRLDHMLSDVYFDASDKDCESKNRIIDDFRKLLRKLRDRIDDLLWNNRYDDKNSRVKILKEIIDILQQIFGDYRIVKDIVKTHPWYQQCPNDFETIFGVFEKIYNEILELYKKLNKWFTVLGIYNIERNKIVLYVPAIGRSKYVNATLEATLAHELFHAMHNSILVSLKRKMHDYLNDDNGNTVCESLASFFEYAWCVKGAKEYCSDLHNEVTLENLKKYGEDRRKEAFEDLNTYPDWPYAGAYGLIREYDDLVETSNVAAVNFMIKGIVFDDMMSAYDILHKLNQDYMIINTRIAGRSYGLSKKCQIGQQLTLTRERDNKFDSNAIIVNSNLGKLGYLPRNIAKDLALIMDCGHHVDCIVVDFVYGSSGSVSNLKLKINIINK